MGLSFSFIQNFCFTSRGPWMVSDIEVWRLGTKEALHPLPTHSHIYSPQACTWTCGQCRVPGHQTVCWTPESSSPAWHCTFGQPLLSPHQLCIASGSLCCGLHRRLCCCDHRKPRAPWFWIQADRTWIPDVLHMPGLCRGASIELLLTKKEGENTWKCIIWTHRESP